MRASAYCAPAALAAATAVIASSLKSGGSIPQRRTRISGAVVRACARVPIAVNATAADAVVTNLRRETDIWIQRRWMNERGPESPTTIYVEPPLPVGGGPRRVGSAGGAPPNLGEPRLLRRAALG